MVRTAPTDVDGNTILGNNVTGALEIKAGTNDNNVTANVVDYTLLLDSARRWRAHTSQAEHGGASV